MYKRPSKYDELIFAKVKNVDRMRVEQQEDGHPASSRIEGAFQHTGVEGALAADHDEQIGLAVECAFEKYVEKGPRVTELWGGLFCIVRAPKFYV